MFNMKYMLNFLLLVISTCLTVSSHQTDQRHRTSKQSFKSRTTSHIDHRNGPYRGDFRAESRQETHLVRNSNLTDESAQQPENGPPNKFWYNQYVGKPMSKDGSHDSMKISHNKPEEGIGRSYDSHNPVVQSVSEFKDAPRDKYGDNEDMQYHHNQEDRNAHDSKANSFRGNEPPSNSGREFKYVYSVSNDANLYPRHEEPEGYNKRPPSYTHSSEYISDKKLEEETYLKTDVDYYQPHPYTSFSNSSSSSSNEHLDDHQRAKNDLKLHQDNPDKPNVKESLYPSKFRSETSSNSGYKHSGYPEEPYFSPGYRDSPQHYHTNSQKANSRLPQGPSPQYTNQPETLNGNFNNHNPKSKRSSFPEESDVSDGRVHQTHQRNTHGQQYEARNHHEQFHGKTRSQQPLSEESSNGDDKNVEHQDNGKVPMRVVSRKKDMQQAPSETDSSIAEEHDGFLDMGAYTDKQGSFGWYADFPVGKEHDKVTYSFS